MINQMMSRNGRILQAPCDHLQQFQVALHELGRTAGVETVLLLDLSGQVLTSRSRSSDLAVEPVASLTSGKWVAACTLAGSLSASQQCNFIIHEYDDFRLLLTLAGKQQILLTVTAPDVPVGWTRIQMQRIGGLCATIEQHTNLQLSLHQCNARIKIG